MKLMLLFSELLSELLYGPLPADELLYTAALSRPVRMAFAVLLLLFAAGAVVVLLATSFKTRSAVLRALCRLTAIAILLITVFLILRASISLY